MSPQTTMCMHVTFAPRIQSHSLNRNVSTPHRAEVSLTFHSLSFVIRLTLEVLTFAQAAECIHKLYDVSAELILYCSF